jgi:hypothetical protein
MSKSPEALDIAEEKSSPCNAVSLLVREGAILNPVSHKLVQTVLSAFGYTQI